MNPKTRKFRVRPCAVCSYPFSDAHHLYPRSKGGQETIYLCPNHHRFANIVQIILAQGGWKGEKILKDFAFRNFDQAFNDKILNHLIGDYYSEACDVQEKKEQDEFLSTLSPQQREEYNKLGEKIRKLSK